MLNSRHVSGREYVLPKETKGSFNFIELKNRIPIIRKGLFALVSTPVQVFPLGVVSQEIDVQLHLRGIVVDHGGLGKFE